MQIFVWNGIRTTTLEPENTDTVLSIKEKMGDKIGIPPQEQTLIWHGIVLQDESILSDYGIKKEQNIYLILKKQNEVIANNKFQIIIPSVVAGATTIGVCLWIIILFKRKNKSK